MGYDRTCLFSCHPMSHHGKTALKLKVVLKAAGDK